jgi:hypothetical protein
MLRFKFYLTIAISFFILGFSSLPIKAQVTINGYVKNFSVLYSFPDTKSFSLWMPPERHILGSVDQRYRLTLRDHFTPWLFTEVAYELSLRIQDPLLFKTNPIEMQNTPLNYRAIDSKSLIYPANPEKTGSFGVLSNIDRCYISLNPEFCDIYIGRQALAWGSAKVINPTDVIAPFTFNALDTEDRPGIDLVRLRIPTQRLAEIDLGYIFGKNWQFKQSAFYIRSKQFWLGSDFSILLLGFRKNALLGFDLTRSLGGAGLWIEAAQVWTDVFNRNRPREKEDYFRFSTGIDYSLSPTLYGLIEYHYNGAGELEAKNYQLNILKIAYNEGSVYLMSRHYLAPVIVYQLSPLITLSFQSLCNLADLSVFLAPSAEYNIAQDIFLAAGVFLGVGREPAKQSYKSEFTGYPDIYYTSFRIYF